SLPAVAGQLRRDRPGRIIVVTDEVAGEHSDVRVERAHCWVNGVAVRMSAIGISLASHDAERDSLRSGGARCRLELAAEGVLRRRYARPRCRAGIVIERAWSQARQVKLVNEIARVIDVEPVRDGRPRQIISVTVT